MPDITITVPAAAVPFLVAASNRKLTELGVDMTGMTDLQKGKRYIAEVLKDVVRSETNQAAQASTIKAAVDAAPAAATTNSSGIV